MCTHLSFHHQQPPVFVDHRARPVQHLRGHIFKLFLHCRGRTRITGYEQATDDLEASCPYPGRTPPGSVAPPETRGRGGASAGRRRMKRTASDLGPGLQRDPSATAAKTCSERDE